MQSASPTQKDSLPLLPKMAVYLKKNMQDEEAKEERRKKKQKNNNSKW